MTALRANFWISAATFCLFFAGCGGGGGGSDNSVAELPVGNSPPPDPVSNDNIDNPTLVIADNKPIGSNGAMTLVWSDEFDGARLDPETWYFELGDGCPDLSSGDSLLISVREGRKTVTEERS